MPEPENGISWVAEQQTEAVLAAVRRTVNRRRPFGTNEWMEMVLRQLGLQATMRPRGRPRKEWEMMKEL